MDMEGVWMQAIGLCCSISLISPSLDPVFPPTSIANHPREGGRPRAPTPRMTPGNSTWHFTFTLILLSFFLILSDLLVLISGLKDLLKWPLLSENARVWLRPQSDCPLLQARTVNVWSHAGRGARRHDRGGCHNATASGQFQRVRVSVWRLNAESRPLDETCFSPIPPQLIKLNRRLQHLEEENKERTKREMILYSVTVAFWLVNTWVWLRRWFQSAAVCVSGINVTEERIIPNSVSNVSSPLHSAPAWGRPCNARTRPG